MFEYVLVDLKAGSRIARKCWLNEKALVLVDGQIVETKDKEWCGFWIPTQVDILATDWYVCK